MRKECWWCLFQLQRVSALHYSFVYRVKIIKKMRSRTTRSVISPSQSVKRKEEEKNIRAADSTKHKAHARRRDVETTRCSETERALRSNIPFPPPCRERPCSETEIETPRLAADSVSRALLHPRTRTSAKGVFCLLFQSFSSGLRNYS